MTDEIRIQHVFRDPETGFTDAIVLPKADYEKLSEADIEAVKAERIAAHVERLANPPVEVPPSKAEVEAELVAVREQKAVLLSREAELVAEVDVVAAPVKVR